MKVLYFALQSGPRGPEPVLFHDERPQSRAHKAALVDGSLREVPQELQSLPIVELTEKMKAK